MPKVAVPGRGWGRTLRDRAQALGMLPALIIVAIGFHILSGGRFLTALNMTVVMDQVALNTVLAAGMTFVVLAGGIDLSVSSIMAVSAMAGLLISGIAGLSSVWPLASLAVGLGFGLVNGLLVSALRLPPFIVTLASLTVVLGIARLLSQDMTIYNIHLPYAFLGRSSVFGVPALAIVATIVVVVSWFLLKRTVLGISIYAVGGNEAAARLSGLDVRRIHLFVYGMSGLLSGLAAVMLSSELLGANAMQLGQSHALDAITVVILGGTSLVGGIGSIGGTLIGALIMAVLSNGLILTGTSDMWQHVIRGLVIIGAVVLDRARLMGSIRT